MRVRVQANYNRLGEKIRDAGQSLAVVDFSAGTAIAWCMPASVGAPTIPSGCETYEFELA